MIEAALSESGGRVYGPVRRRCQARHAGIHPGVEDQVAQNQQESLQNCRCISRPATFFVASRSSQVHNRLLYSIRQLANLRQFIVSPIGLFSVT